jgi:hypothetical protein
VITVDGQAVNPSDDRSDDDVVAKAVGAARLELKLCKALVALKPPHDRRSWFMRGLLRR